MKKGKKGLSAPKSDEERIKQGHAAEAVLNSPVFNEAFEILEDKYINSFLRSNLEQRDLRETAYLSLRVLSELRLELESMINGGKLAAKNT